jgi:hypothetical protein
MNKRTGESKVHRSFFRRPTVLGAAFLGVALMGACDSEIDPPFTVDGTGSVEGFVFFDSNEDGVFDPSAGDEALSGVGVAVQNRGTSETFSGGTTQTGANGRFVLADIPAGTHDLLIDTLSVAEGVSICQNPLPVTVYLHETRFTEVRGRPGCLITIAEAKELGIGEFAIVKGIVTSSPGQIDASVTYIEDESAGSKIYSGVLEGQGIEVGDQIEIGGIAEEYNNDFNFESVTLRNLIKDAATPEPLLVTTAEIAASGSDYTDPIQGAFIRIEKAQLVGAFGTAGSSQNGTVDDGSGITQIRVDDGVASPDDLNTLFKVGTCYNINGFGANYQGTAQIFPRSMADVEEVSCN